MNLTTMEISVSSSRLAELSGRVVNGDEFDRTRRLLRLERSVDVLG